MRFSPEKKTNFFFREGNNHKEKGQITVQSLDNRVREKTPFDPNEGQFKKSNNKELAAIELTTPSSKRDTSAREFRSCKNYKLMWKTTKSESIE